MTTENIHVQLAPYLSDIRLESCAFPEMVNVRRLINIAIFALTSHVVDISTR